MKKVAILFLLALTTVGLHAETYKYLVFTTAEGDIAMTAAGTQITFADGNLIAVNGEETQTIALSSLTKFCFSNDVTGIRAVVSAQGLETVEVYSVSGQSMGRFSYTAGTTLPLGKGTYVVKGDNGTKKIVVK
ncbi:MAG: T9SS type A sorting domain-containing protein [Prevotella sp.]|nr:T9SS type A sorting domain-containing protein [Prevotella sp.]